MAVIVAGQQSRWLAQEVASSQKVKQVAWRFPLDKGPQVMERYRPSSVISYWVYVAVPTGGNAATNVVVTETVPAHTRMYVAPGTVNEWSCPNNSPAGTVCTKTLPTAYDLAIIPFYVKVDDDVTLPHTHITNVVRVAAAEPDPDLSNNVFTSTLPLDLSNLVATKSAQLFMDVNGNGLADTDDEIAYQINVTNTGIVSASNVMIEDGIVEAYALYARELVSTMTTTLGTIEQGFAAEAIGVRARISALNPSQAAEIRFRAKVRSDLPISLRYIENFARVFNSFGHVTTTNNVTTPVPVQPELEIIKSFDQPSGAGNPGPTIFNISYKNNGSVAASGVVVREVIPANATVDLANSTPGWICLTNQCDFAVGEMPPYPYYASNSGYITFTVVPTPSVAPEITQTTNIVRIGDDGLNGADPILDNNIYTLTVPFGLSVRCYLSRSRHSLC